MAMLRSLCRHVRDLCWTVFDRRLRHCDGVARRMSVLSGCWTLMMFNVEKKARLKGKNYSWFQSGASRAANTLRLELQLQVPDLHSAHTFQGCKQDRGVIKGMPMPTPRRRAEARTEVVSQTPFTAHQLSLDPVGARRRHVVTQQGASPAARLPAPCFSSRKLLASASRLA